MKYFLLLALTLLLSCSRNIDTNSSATYTAPEEKPLLKVESLTVTKGKLIPYIEASGTVEGVNEVWVISESQGIVISSDIKLGQNIKKGDTILNIDSQIQKLDMELTKQNYLNSQLDYNANLKLFNQGNISQSEINRLKYSYTLSKTQYQLAQKRFEQTTIRSPIDGSIAVLGDYTDIGDYITAGSRVARVVDNSSYRIKLYLGESQIVLAELGAKAYIKINGQSFIGKVTEIGAGSNQKTGSFPIVIEWKDGQNSLISGLSASVKIETKNEFTAIIVPSDTISVKNRESIVFTHEEGRATKRVITPGKKLGDYTEVLKGLIPEEEIITTGISILEDGTPVISENIGISGEIK